MALSMQLQCFLFSGKMEFVDTDFIWMVTTIESLISLTEYIDYI